MQPDASWQPNTGLQTATAISRRVTQAGVAADATGISLAMLFVVSLLFQDVAQGLPKDCSDVLWVAGSVHWQCW